MMLVPKIALVLMVSLAVGAVPARAEGAPAPVRVKSAAPTKPPDKPPNKPSVKRRAVRQIVDGMPAYGPRLNAPPPVPLSALAAPSSAPSPVAPPPAVINRCDAGGCTDVNGTRYNGAAGNTVIGPQGRSCTANGGTIQCF
ncbi:hypothetical protein IV454_16790 [Massilia antarctica]|uniref:Uncharacterized protein n=1 Tax=Massilia antarctica TaxID=2765360 RepID=A0AA49ABJ4_9BURK|nr:hypothetical protein [Massilia antarctica]QPI52997.1 hypothetical protein IV454_16790 [Massilia antarctica]